MVKKITSQGIFFKKNSQNEKEIFLNYINEFDLAEHTSLTEDQDGIQIYLPPEKAVWSSCHNIENLTKEKSTEPKVANNVLFEILSAMLSSPQVIAFPSYQELIASINIRKNIVEAAQKTLLSFATLSAERPKDYWKYDPNTGFTILPKVSLEDALEKATQPKFLQQPYSFSCWRATEYVFLLSLAKELKTRNPDLLQSLEKQWKTSAIKSDEFNNCFLSHLGSHEKPLPATFYIPGDRVWFRNPDEPSAQVTGYEGSFVFYLGNGFFTNFWKKDKPFTLISKCVEIYHWRNAVVQDSNGEAQIDEHIVEKYVKETLSNQASTEEILSLMIKMRDPDEFFKDGGCIDYERAQIRNICLNTANINFPLLN